VCHRVASRRVASRLELTVARYRSFEAALRCRWPHDNIDKLPAANSRQTQRLVIDVVVGASLMTQTAENVDPVIRIFSRESTGEGSERSLVNDRVSWSRHRSTELFAVAVVASA